MAVMAQLGEVFAWFAAERDLCSGSIAMSVPDRCLLWRHHSRIRLASLLRPSGGSLLRRAFFASRLRPDLPCRTTRVHSVGRSNPPRRPWRAYGSATRQSACHRIRLARNNPQQRAGWARRHTTVAFVLSDGIVRKAAAGSECFLRKPESRSRRTHIRNVLRPDATAGGEDFLGLEHRGGVRVSFCVASDLLVSGSIDPPPVGSGQIEVTAGMRFGRHG